MNAWEFITEIILSVFLCYSITQFDGDRMRYCYSYSVFNFNANTEQTNETFLNPTYSWTEKSEKF